MAATRTNAELLAMDDKLGTLVPGKLADVLVVRGKPDVELTDLTKVEWVVRDGEIVVERGRAVLPNRAPLPHPPPRRY